MFYLFTQLQFSETVQDRLGDLRYAKLIYRPKPRKSGLNYDQSLTTGVAEATSTLKEHADIAFQNTMSNVERSTMEQLGLYDDLRSSQFGVERRVATAKLFQYSLNPVSFYSILIFILEFNVRSESQFRVSCLDANK